MTDRMLPVFAGTLTASSIATPSHSQGSQLQYGQTSFGSTSSFLGTQLGTILPPFFFIPTCLCESQHFSSSSTSSFLVFFFLTQFGYFFPNIVFIPFFSYPAQQASPNRSGPLVLPFAADLSPSVEPFVARFLTFAARCWPLCALGSIAAGIAPSLKTSDLQSENSSLVLFPQLAAPFLRHLTKAPDAYAEGHTE